jgi:insertion element IS1 protein InsB
MGFLGIEWLKVVHHTTRINWVKSVGKLLPGVTSIQKQFQQVGELNACQDNKIWVWTAVDHFKKGILGWVIGDHSSKTFRPLWE